MKGWWLILQVVTGMVAAGSLAARSLRKSKRFWISMSRLGAIQL